MEIRRWITQSPTYIHNKTHIFLVKWLFQLLNRMVKIERQVTSNGERKKTYQTPKGYAFALSTSLTPHSPLTHCFYHPHPSNSHSLFSPFFILFFIFPKTFLNQKQQWDEDSCAPLVASLIFHTQHHSLDIFPTTNSSLHKHLSLDQTTYALVPQIYVLIKSSGFLLNWLINAFDQFSLSFVSAFINHSKTSSINSLMHIWIVF